MAYYDENGKITIDENAAQYDIRQLQRAVECLDNSRRTLNELIRRSAEMQGATGGAINEKTGELKSQIDRMIDRLNETIAFIRRTVAHYQWLDQKVKEIITFSDNGGDR